MGGILSVFTPAVCYRGIGVPGFSFRKPISPGRTIPTEAGRARTSVAAGPLHGGRRVRDQGRTQGPVFCFRPVATGRAAGIGSPRRNIVRTVFAVLTTTTRETPMLILSRRCEQEIVIGDGDDTIVLRVLEIRGDQVRLGITAPREIPVHRREIERALTAEHRRHVLPRVACR